MLISPAERTVEDLSDFALRVADLIYTSTEQPIPAHTGHQEIKIGDGQTVVHFEVKTDNHIKVIDTYTLQSFVVRSGTAIYTFASGSGELFEGTAQTVKLNPALSVWLVNPIILLPSKYGLRSTFRFNFDSNTRLITQAKFKALIGQQGERHVGKLQG